MEHCRTVWKNLTAAQMSYYMEYYENIFDVFIINILSHYQRDSG
nr:MAG TPA: hypothetical protein [Caudoviricetes sp.]